MHAREVATFAALVMAALLACKAKAKVNGTVSLNGAAFEVQDCGTGHSSSTFGGGTTTTNFVSLIDAAGNRIQISESGHAVSVTYMQKGGTFAEVGDGCGTLSFTTPPASNPSAAAGSFAVDCTGSGYHVVARGNFEQCGTYGL